MPRIPRVAAYTFRLQWPGVWLLGLSFGVINLSTFVVKRSLGAPEVVVFLLIALFQGFWTFAPAIGPLISRADPQRVWRWIGVFAFAPVMLVGLVAVRPTGAHGYGEGNLLLFLVAVGLYYAMLTAYIPHRGALLRTNYAPQIRGRMYGLVSVVTLLGFISMSKIGGRLLDEDPRWLRVLFPVAALLGLAGCLIHARIRWRGQRRPASGPETSGPHAGLREAFRILRDNREFRIYESAFMLYGFGFLMSWALLTLHPEQTLKLSYDSFTWAQGVAYPVAFTLFMPLWGRFADRFGIVRSTAVAFTVLAVFYALMPFVNGPTELVAAFALWGFGMAGLDLGWSLGPLHFAPEGKAHMYAAIHFCLVGLRSLVAPLMGYLVLKLVSSRATFWTSTLLEILAILVILRLAGRRSP
ncbi:MAG: MFS transporter [Planctomycetota bacterium]